MREEQTGMLIPTHTHTDGGGGMHRRTVYGFVAYSLQLLASVHYKTHLDISTLDSKIDFKT